MISGCTATTIHLFGIDPVQVVKTAALRGRFFEPAARGSKDPVFGRAVAPCVSRGRLKIKVSSRARRCAQISDARQRAARVRNALRHGVAVSRERLELSWQATGSGTNSLGCSFCE